MATVNKAIVLLFNADKAFETAQQATAQQLNEAGMKVADAFMAYVGGLDVTYDDLTAKANSWIDYRAEQYPALERKSHAKAWQRDQAFAERFHNFVKPKSTNPDAVRKQANKTTYDLSMYKTADDLKQARLNAIAEDDEKLADALKREIAKRTREVASADKQSHKIYLKDLITKVKEVDHETAQVLNWVLVHTAEVKSFIKSQVK